MGTHNEDGSTTCDECLDWRLDQTRSMGAHVAALISAVLSDLGIDVRDETVGSRVAERMREYGAIEGLTEGT